MDHEASSLGLSIGDENLRNQVVGVSAFQSIDGSFSRDNYRFALENAGLSEAEFESNLREETARSLVEAAVVSGLTMPDTYANQLLNYIGERRNFTWARIDATDLDAAIVAPSETVLGAFYTDNLELYTTPEIKQKVGEEKGVPLVKTLEVSAGDEARFQFKHLSFQEGLFARNLLDLVDRGKWTGWVDDEAAATFLNNAYMNNTCRIAAGRLGTLLATRRPAWSFAESTLGIAGLRTLLSFPEGTGLTSDAHARRAALALAEARVRGAARLLHDGLPRVERR